MSTKVEPSGRHSILCVRCIAHLTSNLGSKILHTMSLSLLPYGQLPPRPLLSPASPAHSSAHVHGECYRLLALTVLLLPAIALYSFSHRWYGSSGESGACR